MDESGYLEDVLKRGVENVNEVVNLMFRDVCDVMGFV